MKKLIHNYLSDRFYIESEFIHDISSNSQVFSLNLTIELETVFGLKRKQLKWYIKSWAKKQKKGFDFNFWWEKGPIVYNFNFNLKTPVLNLSSIDFVNISLVKEEYSDVTHYTRVGDAIRLDHPIRHEREYLTELKRIVDDMPMLELYDF
jgi:hypothetical protein